MGQICNVMTGSLSPQMSGINPLYIRAMQQLEASKTRQARKTDNILKTEMT